MLIPKGIVRVNLTLTTMLKEIHSVTCLSLLTSLFFRKNVCYRQFEHKLIRTQCTIHRPPLITLTSTKDADLVIFAG